VAAKLSYAGHLLMENRSALIADMELSQATGYAERETALTLLRRLPKSARRRTVAGDKGYDTRDFVAGCREIGVTPHVAQNTTHRRSAIDGRTTRHAGHVTSLRIRKAKHMLARQIENYQGDPRAVFVYTFTPHNITEAGEVAEELARQGCRLTFNIFSAPVGYTGALRHTPESLGQTRRAVLDLLARYPENVLYSPYNAVAHTHRLGLHDLFGCSYPRCNPSTNIGLGRSFRQYRTDLNWDREAACCVPDTDCPDCRHYAAGSAVITARLFRHACDPDSFNSWLDYVDTYLAVWVMDYAKGINLCQVPVPPPGFDL
jgi:hypothetical protein